MDLNRATIIGRLTRDPELRSLPSGRSVASFSVATNRQWTDPNGQKQKQVEYHNIVVWARLADPATPAYSPVSPVGAPFAGASDKPAEVIEEEIKVEDIPF